MFFKICESCKLLNFLFSVYWKPELVAVSWGLLFKQCHVARVQSGCLVVGQLLHSSEQHSEQRCQQLAFVAVYCRHQLVVSDNYFMRQSCVCELRQLLAHTDVLILDPFNILLLRIKIWLAESLPCIAAKNVRNFQNYPSTSLLINNTFFLKLSFPCNVFVWCIR